MMSVKGTIRAIIVEDDRENLESLCYLLGRHFTDIDIAGTASNLTDGLNLIQQEQFNLAFLDIELPEGSIFNLLEKLRPINFQIIFITAFNEFAIKAFKYSAVDYLLKPLNVNELIEAVDKAKAQIETNIVAKKINLLLDSIHSKSPGFEKIALPTQDGLVFANVNDIIRCEAVGNYTLFYLEGNQKHLVAKTLKDFDELFSQEFFLRIHHTHLINLNKVKKYLKGKGGFVIMNNGDQIEISARRKKEFLDKFS